MICPIANAAWLATCLPEAGRFRQALGRVGAVQEAMLLRLVRANAGTEFGRRYGFGQIRSVADYQQRVPVLAYDEYRSWIDRAAAGAPGVLTGDRVLLFAPTSGSTSGTKLIPYTRSLSRDFQRGIQPWVVDVFTRDRRLLGGPAYWSVSPAGEGPQWTRGGIPIGFEDDSEYVGGWTRRLVQAVMAVPAALRHLRDIEAFRFRTLLALVRCGGLRLVSVWNPAFLTLLIDRLPEWGERLAHELGSDRRRADVLDRALRARSPGERHATLWPRLRMISCWADANAAGPAAHLASVFPQAAIQPKGLIATEGFVSLPLARHDHPVLAVRSHFFEFTSATGAAESADGTRPRLAHELEDGQQYSVVLSTGGGLYRYRLEDVIEVVGHDRQCPLIRFVGRQNHVSDWAGEKLTESFVARVLRDAFRLLRGSPPFAMLACDGASALPGYVLYIESAESVEALHAVARAIEDGLCTSFHYRYARRLGQLAPIRVFRAERAARVYADAGIRRGQRAGEVKPLALDRGTNWSRVLPGGYLEDDGRH